MLIASTEQLTKTVFKMSDKNGNEMIRFNDNGDIHVRGNLIENAKDVVEAFRELLLRPN